MDQLYTAKIYLDKNEILHQDGADVDELYAWMLVQAEGKFGNVHGEIINKKTQESIRKFCKAPPD